MKKKLLGILISLISILQIIGCNSKSIKKEMENNNVEIDFSDVKIENETYYIDEIFYKNEEPTDELKINLELALDNIKNYHPGTAGSSLKVLYAMRDLLDVCSSKINLEKEAISWFSSIDTYEPKYLDESITSVLDSLKMLQNSDIKKIFEENDIEIEKIWDENDFKIAERMLNKILQCFKN